MTSNATSLSAATPSKCLLMPPMASVGTSTACASAGGVPTAVEFSITRCVRVAAATRGGQSAPAASQYLDFLLLHEVSLNRSRKLGGEVDVTGVLGIALHRMWLAGHRVLEHRVREVGRRRLLAACGKRHGPVDRKASMVVLRRDR